MRATTLDEIGAAAGVGRGQLYHFFADKADLVTDVVGYQVDRVISAIQPPFDTMSTADDVRAWCEDATRQSASPTDPVRCPIGSLVYQLDADAVAARAALRAGFARWEEIFAEGLRRVADNGELQAGTDPSVLAAGLLAAYQGGLLLADVGGNVEPLRRALQTVTDAALIPPAKARRRLTTHAKASRVAKATGG
ncbi:hypothetical protein A5655_13165 [Mycobacterium sp. 1081908.1]|nr:hypothetical protein A5655_13165 [Mycobacterium sp. 1081908.1]